jgi:hypothetical protein
MIPSVRFGIAQIESLAPYRPPGYVDAVKAAGRVIEAEGIVELTREAYDALRAEYSPEPWQLPDATEIFSNVTRAIVRFTRAGFRVVTREEYLRRVSICKGCPARPLDTPPWIGACERCGCGQIKHLMATEKCPVNNWSEVPPP